jgi:ribonuclease G
MADELLINSVPGEVRAALVSDGRLVELFVERRGRESLVGNVYLGRVERMLNGMEAAFVDIGIGRAGFLGMETSRGGVDAVDERLSAQVHEGEAVLVQVVKDAIGRKGVQLTRRIALAGRHLVYTPMQPRVTVSRQIEEPAEQARLAGLVAGFAEKGEGFIVRTAAAGADAEELVRDAHYLRGLWVDVEAGRDQGRAPKVLHAEPDALLRILRDHVHSDVASVRIDGASDLALARRFCGRFMPEIEPLLGAHEGDRPLFAEYDIDDEIDRALSPRVALPSGGTIVIEQTEALTAVDVNSGRFVGGSRLSDTALRINLEAAAEIARQIRLRNLAGLIAIDFIHLDEDAAWEPVLNELGRALARDRTPTRLIGRTGAGLVEVTRRRRREPLSASLLAACSACDGTGRRPSPETVAYDILRALPGAAKIPGPAGLTVHAAPSVIEALSGAAREALDELVPRIGRPVTLRSVRDYPVGKFEISATETADGEEAEDAR